MPDYTHAKIYAIRAPGTDDVYIGSTINKYLSVRLAQHRCSYKKFREGIGHSRDSFKLIEKDGHYIDLVESVNCSCIEELRKREGEIIRSTPSCVNRYIAGRSSEEYHKEHAEQYKERCREWKRVNRDRVNQQARAHYVKKAFEVESRS